MNITFIYPDFLSLDPYYSGAFNEGIGSLSAVLKNAGHRTSLIHITDSNYSKKDFLRDISRTSPDLIAFSTTTITFAFVKKILRWMEEETVETPTICGGIHPTVASEDAISTRRIDMICIGEGEQTLLELVDRMELGDPDRDIPGLWYKSEDGTIVRGALRPLIKDLDSLPDPDRELFDLESCSCERHGIGVFMVSRGCPYSCTYCVNRTLLNMFGARNFVRYRSVESVIKQIRDVTEKYPFIKSCFFNDDILFLKLKWSEEFAERYAKEVNLPYECNIRPALFDERRAALKKKSNCIAVRIGIESGNEYIRNGVLKRKLAYEDLKGCVELCRKYGLSTASYNMVGLPFDTAKTVLETIKLNVELEIDETQVTIFYPFPGTECFEICRKNGMLANDDRALNDYFSDSPLDLPGITRDQIRFFRYNFHRLGKLYQAINKIPEPRRSMVEKTVDGLLTRSTTSVLVNSARSVFRKGRAIYRHRMLQTKSKEISEAYNTVKRHKRSQPTM